MPSASSPSAQLAFTYAPGDVIAGKYALEELLGIGGMGAVFRARNTTIDMPVALKLIRADLDRELLSGRLLQEARAAAKLAHPAIVRVFDVGKTALGDPFIVMELLHGESLASLVDRGGRLSSVRAVQLLLPIADALAVAHAKGFVHRDVKPDNVFIANDEEGQLQPKLVDFGIVKHERQDGDSKLTQVGSVLGSPDYMSPEQARGLDTIDQRSDVWSFSVVLYEVIAGVAPFEASNYNALLRLIVESTPASLRELSAADQELSDLVARGLSKDPAERFPTMGLMGKALATWLHAQGATEDACGVSLEARWLSRTSDPSLHRISRSSSPDSWPEPPSGVRAVARPAGELGHAPTLPFGKQAQTPFTHPPPPGQAPPVAPQRRIYWAAAGFGALAALVAGWLVTRAQQVDESALAPARALSAAPLPPAATRLAPTPSDAVPSDTEPAQRSEATVEATPEEVEPAKPSSNVTTRQPSKVEAKAVDAKRADAKAADAKPPSPPAPRSDLLSPY